MKVRVELSKAARKALEHVPPHVRRKLLAWVEAVEEDGLDEVRKLTGYHDEPLKGRRLGQRSIRLSRGYRAIYVVHSEALELVEVQEVHKHDY